MATRLPLATGYDAGLRRTELARVLRAAPMEQHLAAVRGSGLFAAESRPVLRIAAIICMIALSGLGIFALALVAVLTAP